MHERSQVLIVAYNLEAPLKATPFLMTSHSIRTEEVGLLVTAPASVSDALKWANGWQLRQRPAAVHESSRDLYRVPRPIDSSVSGLNIGVWSHRL